MVKTEAQSGAEIAARLQALGNDVIGDIELKKNPSMAILTRALNNVYFDEDQGLIKLGDKKQNRYYINLNQAKKFMQTLLVAKQIKWLLEQQKPALSIRQLYYTLKHSIEGSKEETFDSQDESDPLIEDVEVMVDALREELRLIATPKGVLAGPMVVLDQTGDTLDFTKMGSAGGAVPPSVEENTFEIKECSADFILVIEKFAVWNLLNQQKYWKDANCLIMTGKGQPARAERRLLHRMQKEVKVPIYVFTDMDPWGYYIYSVYKQGSINLAFFSEKAGSPKANYLGFSTSDIKQFDIPRSAYIKLKDVDYKRLKEIEAYDWFKSPGWKKEFAAMKQFGYKVEQDSLVAKSIEFTAKEYLPTKIENKQFIA